MKKYRYLFGPVPSRRLGLSLGVDLVPPKTCTFDCVFCQAGATTRKTLARRAHVPLKAVLAELSDWIDGGGRADYITLAGSGEPTLHSDLGRIIDHIHRRSDLKVAILTNGSLLHIPAVRRAAAKADMVKVSLNAPDAASFAGINRPHKRLDFDTVLDGIRAFRRLYRGKLWLEIFLVPGMNASAAQARRLAELAEELGPDKIHLNTAVRPPSEKSVRPVSAALIGRLARLFPSGTEAIAEFKSTRQRRAVATPDAVVALVKRHPSTAADIAAGLSVERRKVASLLARLVADGRVRGERRGGRIYYV